MCLRWPKLQADAAGTHTGGSQSAGKVAGSKAGPFLATRIMMPEPLGRLALCMQQHAIWEMPTGARHATLGGSNGKTQRRASHRRPGGSGCRGQLSTCNGVSCIFRCCDLSS